MKRVLIVGNSHATALKFGWDAIAATCSDNVTVTFFAAPAPFFDRLGVSGSLYGDTNPGILTAEEVETLLRINGQTTVDLDDFDDILLAGMFWPGVNEIGHYLKAFSIDGLYEVAKPQRLTATAFTEFYTAALATRPPPPFWSTPRHARMTVMLSPMPVALVRLLKSDQMLKNGIWTVADIEVDKMRPLLDYQKTLAATHYANHGIHLLPQPPITLTEAGFTKDAFCRDPLNLADNPDHKFDVHHMNGRYGTLCLHAYFEHILSGSSAG